MYIDVPWGLRGFAAMGFEAQRLAQFSGFSIRAWNSENSYDWLGPSVPTLSNLGTLVHWPRPCTSCMIYSQQQFEDLLKAVCQTDPCVR